MRINNVTDIYFTFPRKRVQRKCYKRAYRNRTNIFLKTDVFLVKTKALHMCNNSLKIANLATNRCISKLALQLS